MPIEFRCKGCGRVLRTPDGTEGKKARCPQCGAIEEVPASSTWTGAGGPGPFGDTSAESSLAPPPAAAAFPDFPPSGDAAGASRNPFADSSGGGPFGPPMSPGGTAGAFATGAPYSANPYAAPLAGPDDPFSVNRPYAASKVGGPAIGLMVVAIIGILGQVAGAMVNTINVQAPGVRNAGPPPIPGWVHVIPALIGIGIGVVILLGALKMKQLESYGFAMTAAVLAMVPCLSPCCLIGLPVGIWAIVTLNDVHVKSAFR